MSYLLYDVERKREIGAGDDPPNSFWRMEACILRSIRDWREAVEERKEAVRAKPGTRRHEKNLRAKRSKLLHALWAHGLSRVPYRPIVNEATQVCGQMERDLDEQIDGCLSAAQYANERLKKGVYLRGRKERKTGDPFSSSTRARFQKMFNSAMAAAKTYQEQLEQMRGERQPITRYCAAPFGIQWIDNSARDVEEADDAR